MGHSARPYVWVSELFVRTTIASKLLIGGSIFEHEVRAIAAEIRKLPKPTKFLYTEYIIRNVGKG
jgi:hypothetical protein